MSNRHEPRPVTRSVEDYLGRAIRDLRLSVTDRCNLRCNYCMPAAVFDSNHNFLPARELLSYEELVRVAGVFSELGTRKIRITGGEPLVRRELPELIRQLSQLDGIEEVALTTNAVLLPVLAKPLKKAGLARITISLDAIDNETFQKINGRNVTSDQVLAGLDAAVEAGFEQIKVNMVVQKGVNEHQVVPMAEHFMGTPHIVRFIEFMDVGATNGWDLSRVLFANEILALVQEKHATTPLNRVIKSDVAQRFSYADKPGEFGIISSVSAPFCGDCTRARISSDGVLFTCLFATNGTPLKSVLRTGASDTELSNTIQEVWTNRRDRYSEIRSAQTNTNVKKVEMSYIGG